MKKMLSAAVVTFVLLLPLTAFAQEEEENTVSPFTLQSRVGGVYTGGDPFGNGATFEVGVMYRLIGPLNLSFFGGYTNYTGTGDFIPSLTEDFTSFWNSFLEQYDVVNIDKLSYRVNFGGGGVTFVKKIGRLEPLVTAGIGAYQVKLTSTFSYVEKVIPDPYRDAFSTFVSLQDSKVFFGYNIGAGLYYSFNQIISFGGQVTYHIIDTNAIENLVSATFGMNIKIP